MTPRPPFATIRWALSTATATTLLSASCVSTPAETSTTGPKVALTAEPTATAEEVIPSATAGAPQPSLPLQAHPHIASMHEVVLAPDGSCALTLDTRGSVRLWPTFDEGGIPWELPIEEPLWMSLAPNDSGFVVAFIDTAGAAHVGRVEVSGASARWIAAFDVPPMDPMFEVHVLGGGERLLALGVDHRVRLWDLEGNTIAQLDERGVVPWQLRVQHDADGKPHAALVQFGPVRIQRLEVSDAGLELKGDAHPLAIDQSPNRNDIAMSPDGRYATAMQKPTGGNGRFELEVVNLHDGSRRMLVAESDTGFRPRIHPLVDEILAETGSGNALRLSLDAAVPWQVGADRAALSPQATDALRWSGSTEQSLMHTTLRGGVHAVAWDRALHVHAADAQHSRVIAHDTFVPTAVGLSPTGATVAWASPAGIVLESASGEGPVRMLSPTAAPTNLLAFVGSEQLVAMDTKGRVQLRDLKTDAVLDTTSLPVGWEALHTGWRASATGGWVVLSSTRPSAPLQILAVEPGEFGSLVEVERSQRSHWPEGGKPPRAESTDWMRSQGYDLAALGLKPAEVLRTLPGHRDDRSVVVQRGEITMIHGTTNQRLWARSSPWIEDMAWSDDGRWLAFTDNNGGYVCDAESGEVVLKRHTLARAPASAAAHKGDES